MTYIVKCPRCGRKYTSAAKFCMECGEALIRGEVAGEDISVKSKPRIRAEKVMSELDEIIPRLKKAYEEYLAVSVEWYDRRNRLRYYLTRGVVSEDEVQLYTRPVSMIETEKSYSQRLKEYRACKAGKQA